MIWRRQFNLQQMSEMAKGCMLGHLGIEITAFGDDFLEGTMPVDERTKQPFGLLHGGASVVLAESLGSIAGYLCSEGEQRVVGLEINANHIRSAREGVVKGICRPIHIGRRQQVWNIDIFNEKGQLCCTSRLTTAVISE